MKHIIALAPGLALVVGLALVPAPAPVLAQDAPSPLRVNPQDDVTYGFVIDRRTSVRRDPGHTYDTPRKRKVVSTVRLRPRPGTQPDRVVLEVTFVRVNGYESGGELLEDVTFDRSLDAPHSGRPETLVVGRTVEVETRRDGTLVAIRGVDDAIPGSPLTATATLADLRALVTQLPPAGTAGSEWTSETLEGRALLRIRVAAAHEMQDVTDGETEISVAGKITAAPDNAGEAFAKSFRVWRGERAARYRVSRADGLPLEGRLTTSYAVEAQLTSSEMTVGVDSETVVTVRRTATPDDPTSAGVVARAAPVPGDTTPNTGLPGWLGTPRDVIHRLAGKPTRTGGELVDGDFDTYGALGLVYEYDDDSYVRRVTATRVAEGDSFQGKILGLKLSDPLSRAIELWGALTSRTKTKSEYDVVQFAFDTALIELEVWRVDGEDPALGAYAADSVKRIRITDRR